MKILLIQLRRIGDVVFTLPVAQALRKFYPAAQIDFLVEPPSDQLLNFCDDISHILKYDKKNHWFWMRKIYASHYDAVLDFHANGRALWLTLASQSKRRIGFEGAFNRKLIYTETVPHDPKKFIVDDKLLLVQKLTGNPEPILWNWNLKLPQEILQNSIFPEHSKMVGLLAVHRHSIRSWEQNSWIKLAQKFLDNHYNVLWLGGPSEGKILQHLNENFANHPRAKTIEAKNLLELSALIQKCDVLVANDNGPQKIAMALNRPTVTIFGPTNPVTINPRNALHIALRDESLPCIGCEKSVCPTQHECMQNISVEQVYEKTIKFL